MTSLGWFVAAVAGAVSFGVGGFFIKLGTTRHRDSGLIVLLGLYITGALSFVVYAGASGSITLEPAVIIGGVIIGMGAVVGNMFFIRAFSIGPASLSGPLINTYGVLIIFMSILFFGERLRVTEVIGVGMILVAVGLINYDPNETLRISNNWWYVFLGIAILSFFVRNGGLKVTEELGYNNTMVLACGYVTGLIWFGAALWRRRDLIRSDYFRFALGWGLAAGFLSFGGLQLFTIALATGPASIIAPIFSANGLIFATLTILFLGERLSRYQAIALIGCITALVVLRL